MNLKSNYKCLLKFNNFRLNFQYLIIEYCHIIVGLYFPLHKLNLLTWLMLSSYAFTCRTFVPMTVKRAGRGGPWGGCELQQSWRRGPYRCASCGRWRSRWWGRFFRTILIPTVTISSKYIF